MDWCIQSGRIVLQCATEGDLESMRIRDNAVELLAQTVASTWRGVSSLSVEAPASYTGGVLSDKEFRSKFFDAVSTFAPNLKWQEPVGDNLDGALHRALSHQVDLPPLLRWWHL
jgi:N-acetylglucosamine kinase-like BadF-type ATPase